MYLFDHKLVKSIYLGNENRTYIHLFLKNVNNIGMQVKKRKKYNKHICIKKHLLTPIEIWMGKLIK